LFGVTDFVIKAFAFAGRPVATLVYGEKDAESIVTIASVFYSKNKECSDSSTSAD